MGYGERFYESRSLLLYLFREHFLPGAFWLISWSEFQATGHDDAHNAFMTLPLYTRTREGEAPQLRRGPTPCWLGLCVRKCPLFREREIYMAGYLLLEGGAEFGGQMAMPDQRALELAGGFEARINIIPTAASPGKNFLHAGNNGVRRFWFLGGTDRENPPFFFSAFANGPQL